MPPTKKEVSTYVKQHNLEERLSAVVNRAIESKSPNPIAFISNELAKENTSDIDAHSLTAVVEQLEVPRLTAVVWIASSTELAHVVARALLHKAPHGQAELETMRTRALGTENQLLQHLQASNLLTALAHMLHQQLQVLVTPQPESTALREKFTSGATFELKYCGLDTFYSGLEGRIGAPDPQVDAAIMREHLASADSHDEFTTWNYGVTTKPSIEYRFVTSEVELTDWPAETKGVEAHAGRRQLPIAELKMRADNKNRELQTLGEPLLLLCEVVAGRLYTGPMFEKYNALLRGFPKRLVEGCKENAYVTTTHAINSIIIKLSKLAKAVKVYRGVAGGSLPDAFWAPNWIKQIIKKI